MAGAYLGGLSSEGYEKLKQTLHASQNGACFICGAGFTPAGRARARSLREDPRPSALGGPHWAKPLARARGVRWGERATSFPDRERDGRVRARRRRKFSRSTSLGRPLEA